MWLDIGFLVFLVLGFLFGYSRGMLKTVYAIISIFIAIFLSFKFSPFIIELLENSLKLGTTFSFILGFILCFFTIVFLVRLIGNMFTKVLKKVKLNFLNKLAGGIVMSVLFIFLYASVLWFFNQTKLIPEPQKKQSMSYYRLEPLPELAKGAFIQLKPAFKGFWEKSKEAIDQSENNNEYENFPEE